MNHPVYLIAKLLPRHIEMLSQISLFINSVSSNEISSVGYNGLMHIYIQKKITSVRYAIAGLIIAWREESNFRFEVACFIFFLILAYLVRLNLIEFVVMIFMFGFILTAELLNTALEELCDKFQPTHDPHIAKIKDLAAAAVFVSALTAFIVGIIIFLPHLLIFV